MKIDARGDEKLKNFFTWPKGFCLKRIVNISSYSSPDQVYFAAFISTPIFACAIHWFPFRCCLGKNNNDGTSIGFIIGILHSSRQMNGRGRFPEVHNRNKNERLRDRKQTSQLLLKSPVQCCRPRVKAT